MAADARAELTPRFDLLPAVEELLVQSGLCHARCGPEAAAAIEHAAQQLAEDFVGVQGDGQGALIRAGMAGYLAGMASGLRIAVPERSWLVH